jgi:hypothetical protein
VSPFSQWHRCLFTAGELTFICAEQYMMHGKAILFGDREIAAEIIAADHPKTHKALGRKVTQSEKISQDAWEDGTDDLRAIVGHRVRSGKPAVLCSHGPVLPGLLAEIALATGTIQGSYLSSASDLDPAAFSVVHLSSTNPGSGIIAIETHIPKI